MFNRKDKAVPGRLDKIAQRVKTKKQLTAEQMFGLLQEAHRVMQSQAAKIKNLEAEIARLRRPSGLILPGGR